MQMTNHIRFWKQDLGPVQTLPDKFQTLPDKFNGWKKPKRGKRDTIFCDHITTIISCKIAWLHAIKVELVSFKGEIIQMRVDGWLHYNYKVRSKKKRYCSEQWLCTNVLQKFLHFLAVLWKTARPNHLNLCQTTR